MLKRQNGRAWLLLMVLTGIMLVCAVGQAQTTELFTSEATSAARQYGGVSIQSMAKAGDECYFLLNTGRESSLYRWKEGMEDAECVAQKLLCCDGASSLEELKAAAKETGADAEHAISYLFADENGERLLSLNLFTGRLFAMRAEGGQMVYEDIPVGASGVFDMDDMYPNPSGVYIEGLQASRVTEKTIDLFFRAWKEGAGEDATMVMSFSLEDGTVRRGEMDALQAMCVGPGGDMYGVYRDELKAYDPETGTVTPYSLVKLEGEDWSRTQIADDMGEYVSAMCYMPGMERFITVTDTKLNGTSLEGDTKQVGFLPTSSYGSMLALDGRILIGSWQGVFLRHVSDNFSADRQVTTYGFYDYEVNVLFSRVEQDTPVYSAEGYYSGADKILEGMKNGDMDIVSMNIRYDPFASLRDKGYCEPLEGYPELVGFVQRVYPVFREQALYRDALVAIPWRVSASDSLSYSMEVLEQVGLTEDDIPDNFIGLCEFITRWNDEYADDYPNFRPVTTYGDLRSMLVNMLITRFVDYCRSTGERVSFASPIFRSCMKAVEDMRTDRLPPDIDLENASEEDWDSFFEVQGILNIDSTSIGFFQSDPNGEHSRLLALTPDTEPYTYASLNMVFINPYSSHKEEALQYLRCVVQSICGTQSEYLLCQDVEEPLPNPDYEAMVQNYRESIELTEKMLASDDTEDSEREEYEKSLEDLKKRFDNIEQYRYSVSEAQLAEYRTHTVPRIRIAQQSFLNSGESGTNEELRSLINRLVSGQIKLDQFIHDADGKLRMMQMEDE